MRSLLQINVIFYDFFGSMCCKRCMGPAMTVGVCATHVLNTLPHQLRHVTLECHIRVTLEHNLLDGTLWVWVMVALSIAGQRIAARMPAVEKPFIRLV